MQYILFVGTSSLIKDIGDGLGRLGHPSHRMASTCQEALDHLSDEPPGLVLIDGYLLETDASFLKNVRLAIEDLPIMIVTSGITGDDHEEWAASDPLNHLVRR